MDFSSLLPCLSDSCNWHTASRYLDDLLNANFSMHSSSSMIKRRCRDLVCLIIVALVNSLRPFPGLPPYYSIPPNIRSIAVYFL